MLVLFRQATSIGPRTAKSRVRLRALRKFAEDTKNHDLERDLYIEERKAERGVYLHQLLGLNELKMILEDITKQKKHVWLEWRLQRRARNAHWLGILAKPDKIARLFAHLLWIAVMGLYWALADYGRSFARPVAWLCVSLRFFYLRYHEVLAPLMHEAGSANADKYNARSLGAGAWQRRAFRRTSHHRQQGQGISVLPLPQLSRPAHSAGMVPIAGDRAKPLFDHLRVFHRPCVAQLF